MPEPPDLPSQVPLEALPKGVQQRLRLVAARAAGRAWLVGGPVRDALLGRPLLDLDLVVEADAPALAGVLPARLLKTTPFGTATIEWPDGAVWDLATARSESYPEPGALPVCRPASLVDDLGRRDFTINAMAAALAPARWGELVDPHGGRQDLAHGLLRTLHADSFRDDPTRLYRAARYAARLGFRLESSTAEQAVAAIGAGLVGTLTPARLLHELERSLGEPPGVAQVAALAALGLWEAVVPGLDIDLARLTRLDQWLAADDAPLAWATRLAGLLPHDDPCGAAQRLTRRLLPSRPAGEVWERVAAKLACGPWRLEARPSEVAAELDGLPEAAWPALAAHWPSLHDAVQSYRSDWSRVRPELDGHALLALGVREGPDTGEVLRQLRRARLDGEIADRTGEVAWVRRWVASRESQDGGTDR